MQVDQSVRDAHCLSSWAGQPSRVSLADQGPDDQPGLCADPARILR